MIRVEDINVDVLDQIADEWEQTRLANLQRDEMQKLAKRLHRARAQASALEANAWQRTRRLYQLGFTVEELVDLLGLTKREINKWLKGMDE